MSLLKMQLGDLPIINKYPVDTQAAKIKELKAALGRAAPLSVLSLLPLSGTERDGV